VPEAERLGADKKREIMNPIIEKLSVHAAIEEQHFYRAVRKEVENLNATVLEGIKEHHLIKLTLNELLELPPKTRASTRPRRTG
jgi:hypothetical protein